MKIIAIIQARLSSKRLPNKVLLPLEDKSVLGHIVHRLSSCKRLNEIVVATSTEVKDKEIVKWCQKNKTNFFRGSLTDVLDRYYRASCFYQADAVVRITADCPVIDPIIVDDLIKFFVKGKYDACSLSGEFPDGLDCQIFSHSAIYKAWRGASLPSEREHVGVYIEKTNRKQFKVGELKKFKGLYHYRWTLDEPEDYFFLKKVFSRLYKKNQIFKTEDIISLMKIEPHLMNINSKFIRNSGYLKSLSDEKLNGII
jgi:spore coat polysaccharide biosynthesis protein SpsF